MRGVAWLGSSLLGSCATESSLSWGPMPPLHLDRCHCVAVHCHCMAIVVVAPVVVVFIVTSSRWLPLCRYHHHHCLRLVVVMGTQGLALAPAAATVAEVSMWGGSLRCGKVMVGVAPGQLCEPVINVSTMWA